MHNSWIWTKKICKSTPSDKTKHGQMAVCWLWDLGPLKRGLDLGFWPTHPTRWHRSWMLMMHAAATWQVQPSGENKDFHSGTAARIVECNRNSTDSNSFTTVHHWRWACIRKNQHTRNETANTSWGKERFKHLTQSRQGLKFFPFGQGRSYFVQMS